MERRHSGVDSSIFTSRGMVARIKGCKKRKSDLDLDCRMAHRPLYHENVEEWRARPSAMAMPIYAIYLAGQAESFYKDRLGRMSVVGRDWNSDDRIFFDLCPREQPCPFRGDDVGRLRPDVEDSVRFHTQLIQPARR